MLDVTEPDNHYVELVAAEADLRTDLPKYCIFRYGELLDEPLDIKKYWRDDKVGSCKEY